MVTVFINLTIAQGNLQTVAKTKNGGMMTDELKPCHCPFCGVTPESYVIFGSEGVRHPYSDTCPLSRYAYDITVWNTRAADQRIAALEAENARLRGIMFDCGAKINSMLKLHPLSSLHWEQEMKECIEKLKSK